MYKVKIVFSLIVLLAMTQLSWTQNNTNSPYTRFGYGELVDNNSSEQRGMGGVAIGSRSNLRINPINPASYSAVDTMSFMFDMGVSALASHFGDPSGQTTKVNSNLEYLTMQFPLAKWLGYSAGLLPYSFLGYNFYTVDSVPVNSDLSTQQYQKYTSSFIGSGGFSQLYMGLSANILQHVSLGVNAYYMFGTMSNQRFLIFSNTTNNTSSSQYNSITASNFRFRYGLQFYNTFAGKHSLTLGFIYEPKANFNGRFSQITSSVLSDTTKAVPTDSVFDMPQTYGFGLSYTYDNRLTIGVDYSMQQWKDARFFGRIDTLNNLSKMAVGVEYVPNPGGRTFSDHIKYRAGFNVSNSYYKIGGITPPDNFVVSLGVGLPVYDKASRSLIMVNTALEYGRIGSLSMLREDYLKLSFNVTFNEHWFFKRKL